MSRLNRIGPAGIPQHIIQRGNNRQVCFACDKDIAAYAHWLKQYAAEFQVAVHAWVFMTNHVHLLVTPKIPGAASQMMQALGRRYVPYFNRQYQRTGTLWEGRFRSSLVQSERYLLQCQRYIELNPVRAAIVTDPGSYFWSSFGCHASGVVSELHSPHSEYLKLDADPEKRWRYYRELFSHAVGVTEDNDIRAAVNKSLALGSNRFIAEVERLYGRRLKPCQMGRPSLHDIKVAAD